MAELKQIVRLCDTDLNGKLTIERSIQKIKGIGFALSRAVRIKAGFDTQKKLGELTTEELQKIEKVIRNPETQNIPAFMFNRQKDYDTGVNKHLISSDLDLEVKSDIAMMRSIKSYKGIRHFTGLKVRGQRTKATGRRGTAIGVSKKKMQPAKSGDN